MRTLILHGATSGATLPLAELRDFHAAELVTTTDGQRVHVMLYSEAEAARCGGRVTLGESPSVPPEPSAADYRAGFDARQRWERERTVRLGGRKAQLLAAIEALEAATARTRAALAEVATARAVVERLSAVRVTAGGNDE